jgi:hypothetical protein
MDVVGKRLLKNPAVQKRMQVRMRIVLTKQGIAGKKIPAINAPIAKIAVGATAPVAQFLAVLLVPSLRFIILDLQVIGIPATTRFASRFISPNTCRKQCIFPFGSHLNWALSIPSARRVSFRLQFTGFLLLCCPKKASIMLS